MPWSARGGHSLPRSTRERIRRRDDGQCQWPISSGPCLSRDGCQVDHRLSVGEGGTDDDHNLWLLCARHHTRKTAGEAARGRARTRIRTPRARPLEQHPGRKRT